MTCGKHLWSEVGKGRGKTTFSPALFINFGNDCGATDRLCGQHLYLGLSKLLSSSLEWTSNFKVDFLTLTLLPPSHENSWLHWIQLDNLRKSPHLKILKWITTAEFLLPCKVTYSHVLGGLRRGPLWGDVFLPTALGCHKIISWFLRCVLWLQCLKTEAPGKGRSLCKAWWPRC